MPAKPPSTSQHQQIAEAVDGIEGQLRQLGVWQAQPPDADRLDFCAAFGADKLTFFEWLQWVLLPRVRAILGGDGEFPDHSEVGVYAVRELDGYRGAESLMSRLCEFDQLFTETPTATNAATSNGPFADHDEFVAHLIQRGVVTPQELTVRGYLIALQVGNPTAARAHLSPPRCDDDGFQPEPPFEIYDFHLQRPELRADCAVVQADLAGTDAAGAKAHTDLPFVLVEHAGRWLIDLDRSMAMQRTGDPRGADEFDRALANFTRDILPQHQAALVERFGTSLQLELQTDGMLRHPDVLRELDRFLAGDLHTAVGMMQSAALLSLREGLQRVVLAFAAHRGERGVFRRDTELRVVLHPGLHGEFRSAVSLCRVLEITASQELASRYQYANERLGHWQEKLAGRHGLDFDFQIDWQRFTQSRDPLTNAWALHLLAEHGIEPLGEVLDAQLGADRALAQRTRTWLRELRLSHAGSPAERGVLRFDADTLLVEVHVGEEFDGYWTALELHDRLRRALDG